MPSENFPLIDETKYVVDRWRMDYNHYRSHSSLGYITPAGMAELFGQAGFVRPQMPVLNGVRDGRIASQTLDKEKGADHRKNERQ